jgi:3-hydroxybutyryl-CoA dehydrogenase
MFSKNSIIGIAGSGAMGTGIAQVAATAGHTVFVYDSNAEQLTRAEKNLRETLSKLVEKGKLTTDDSEALSIRIRFVNTISAFRDCDLIIEAIIENLEIKQELFRNLEEIVSENCVLGTNTSSLSVASIAAACKKPERVIGVHFFNPAPVMPLVEIIPAITTREDLTPACKSLVDSWGKTTVLVKDTPGFIVNRVARSFYGESIRIYEEQMADFATIDWALKTFGGFRMGPFELMDFIGNDVNYKVTETVWQQLFCDPRFKPSLTQKRLYESKRFGRKTGKGYYDYSEGISMPEPKKDETLGQEIFSRVISMLINEAADSLYLGIASREDLDTAMTKGVNYPKGLLKWADEIGIETIYKKLQWLNEEYNEDRYRPCVLLKRMAKEGKRFYP